MDGLLWYFCQDFTVILDVILYSITDFCKFLIHGNVEELDRIYSCVLFESIALLHDVFVALLNHEMYQDFYSCWSSNYGLTMSRIFPYAIFVWSHSYSSLCHMSSKWSHCLLLHVIRKWHFVKDFEIANHWIWLFIAWLTQTIALQINYELFFFWWDDWLDAFVFQSTVWLRFMIFLESIFYPCVTECSARIPRWWWSSCWICRTLLRRTFVSNVEMNKTFNAEFLQFWNVSLFQHNRRTQSHEGW